MTSLVKADAQHRLIKILSRISFERVLVILFVVVVFFVYQIFRFESDISEKSW